MRKGSELYNSLPKRVRFQVLERDGFACRYCGAKAPRAVLHIDHVTPVAAGGGNGFDNLVTACRDCNLGKGALRISDGIDDVQERAIAASMMATALERFGASVPPSAFDSLLDFSRMSGPRPSLVHVIAASSSWEDAQRRLLCDAGYPIALWTANDE